MSVLHSPSDASFKTSARSSKELGGPEGWGPERSSFVVDCARGASLPKTYLDQPLYQLRSSSHIPRFCATRLPHPRNNKADPYSTVVDLTLVPDRPGDTDIAPARLPVLVPETEATETDESTVTDIDTVRPRPCCTGEGDMVPPGKNGRSRSGDR